MSSRDSNLPALAADDVHVWHATLQQSLPTVAALQRLLSVDEGQRAARFHFDVTLTPNEPAQLLATRDDPLEAAKWMLCDVPCPSGYAAALAVGGHGWNCVCLAATDLYALGL